jgi:spoIIIJ-associated protein
MEKKLKTLEISAPTVEEAISKGLAKIGRRREEVEIEVLDKGSRGILGILAREARVSISFLEALTKEERIRQAAKETLEELLKRMGVSAEVSLRPEEDMPKEEDAPPFILDITGDDLGVLIGRRCNTLQALQHITRFIVNRKFRRRIDFVIDVEGYKMRREKALEQLALRMAERVTFSRQPLALEPMPPYERRIIHLTLRDHPVVTTKSVGKGDKRRVTIILKK